MWGVASRRGTQAALAVVMLLSGATTARTQDAPAAARLVNEKKILDLAAVRATTHLRAMRLSPDGAHLLYIRREAVGPAANRGHGYRLVLRDLAANRDIALPFVPFHDGDVPRVILFLGDLFTPDGKRLLLSAGVDANRDGLHDEDAETMEAVLYDIGTGKVTKLGIRDQVVVGVLDGTGASAYFVVGKEKAMDLRLVTTPLAKVALKTLRTKAVPLAACPTARLLPVAEFVGEPDAGPPTFDLQLYDADRGRVVATLPAGPDLGQSGPPVVAWTADGRFLYYAESTESERIVTRVWDRRKGKVAHELKSFVPLGPGARKGTMLLAEHLARRRFGNLFLHDPATGKRVTIADDLPTVVSARGGRVVYVRTDPGGKRAVFVADIQGPR